MIVYRLACGAGHGFEGWYASPEAYARLLEAGRIACPSCGSLEVRKLPSAPYVRAPSAPAARPDALRAEALAKLRSLILAGTENVGRRFPEVARRIHYGEEEQRGIRGQATPREALELLEEGVAALPVPDELRLDDDIPH